MNLATLWQQDNKITLRFLFTLLICHSFIIIIFWFLKIYYAYHLDFVEIEVLNAVYWWKNGQIPYVHPEQILNAPNSVGLIYISNHYGPIYEWLCAQLPIVIHPYFIGRIISLLSTLGIILCIIVWIHKYTNNLICSILAALLLLTAKPIFMWSVFYRVDMLQIFFSVTGFSLVILTKNYFTFSIGIILMGLAFHTKLTAITAPLACFLILWKCQKHKAIVVGIGWLVIALGGLLWLQYITNGAYLFNAQLGNLPTKVGKVFDMLTRPLTSSLFWIVTIIYIFTKSKKIIICKLYPELTYITISLVVIGITAANPGSSWNYLIELYVLLSILTGILIGWIWQKQLLLKSVLIFLILHSIFALFHTMYFNMKDWKEMILFQKKCQQVYIQLLPFLHKYKRIAILDSEAGIDILLKNGRPNPLFLPGPLKGQAERLIDIALKRGQLNIVLIGDSLKPWSK